MSWESESDQEGFSHCPSTRPSELLFLFLKIKLVSKCLENLLSLKLLKNRIEYSI